MTVHAFVKIGRELVFVVPGTEDGPAPDDKMGFVSSHTVDLIATSDPSR